MHDQRGLHAHRRAVARIDALDFARHQAIGRVVGGRAAVLLGQGGAQQAERAHLVHDLAMELLVPVGLQHARHQLVLAVVARGVADRDLLLGELVVEEERVLPVERLGVGADALGGALDRGGGGGHGFSCVVAGSYQGRQRRQPDSADRERPAPAHGSRPGAAAPSGPEDAADRPVRARKISRLSRPKASEARSSTVRGRGRSILRSAAMRPGRGDMTTTRSDRNTASAIEWVTNSTVLRCLAGEVALAPDAQKLERHVVARHGVERAERLVHQQQRRVEQQRAAERGALLHAARQLARQLVAEAFQPRHVQQLLGARRRAPASLPASSAGSSTFCRIERHFSRTGAWKTMPMSGIGCAHGAARDGHRADGGGPEPGHDAQQGGLAAAARPHQRDELARADGERNAGERLDRAARRLVCHADPGRGRSVPCSRR